mmetsp:Transcript_39927/g.94724  ORF Transcript_39927/g.94724 Transcript_39927/m.94724 type:complete len:472 (+) Transcript_39927:90-1505(+)
MCIRSGVNGACLVATILASLAARTACLPAAHRRASPLGVLRTQGPASWIGSARQENLGVGGLSSLVRLRGGGDEGHGHSHGHSHSHSHSAHAHTSPVGGIAAKTLYSALHDLTVRRPEVCAMVAAVLVSSTAFVALPFMPFLTPGEATIEKSLLLKVLVSFAVGGLLADVFLHILPHSIAHASAAGKKGSVEEALAFGMPVLVGILLFYIAEKGIGALTGGHAHHAHHGGGHGHTHHDHTTTAGKVAHVIKCETPGEAHTHVVECAKTAGKKQVAGKGDVKEEKKKWFAAGRDRLAQLHMQAINAVCHQCSELRRLATVENAKPAAYLNLVADIMHNFSDGLALGVAFGKGMGLPTTAAVFFHEVPHNIADFAILIQNGFSHNAALKAQFVSALGAVLGCVAGLRLRDMSGIQGFVAGGFIYIATVDIMPLMLTQTGFGTILMETLAMATGVAMYVAMLRFEAAVPGACSH